MFIRRKVVNGKVYYQAVQSYRDEHGRVRQRTIASLGQHATPGEAIAASQDDLQRLETQLHALEPLGDRSQGNARKVARLRAQMVRLNQRVEKLLACAARMPLSREHQACVDADTAFLPATDTGGTVGLDGVDAQSEEQQAAWERIALLEQQCQEKEHSLVVQMAGLLAKDREEIQPALEDLKTRRVVYARLAWKELCAGQEERALEWLEKALRMQEHAERLLAMRMDILGLGPHDEAARQLGISRETLKTWLQRDPLAAKAGYYVGVADGQARNKRGASRMTAKQLLDNLRPAIIAEASGSTLEYVCLGESRTPEEAAALRQRTIRAKKRLDELTSIA